MKMSSSEEKTKPKCTRFEPQTWRRNLCKNCFKTKSEHKTAQEVSSEECKEPLPIETNAKKAKSKPTPSEKSSTEKTLSKQTTSKSKTGAITKPKEEGNEKNQQRLVKYKGQGDTNATNQSESKETSDCDPSWATIISECEKNKGQHAAVSGNLNTHASTPGAASTQFVGSNTNREAPSSVQRSNLQHSASRTIPSHKPATSSGYDNTVSKEGPESSQAASKPPVITVGNKSMLDKNTLGSQSCTVPGGEANNQPDSESLAKIPRKTSTEPDNTSTVNSQPSITSASDNKQIRITPSPSPPKQPPGKDLHNQNRNINLDKQTLTPTANNDVTKQTTSDVATANQDLIRTEGYRISPDDSLSEGDALQSHGLGRPVLGAGKNDSQSQAPLSPLSPIATEFSQVFDPPLSPKTLDRYRKELFASDDNVPSPKSPTSRFHAEDDGADKRFASSLNNTRTTLDSLIDQDLLQGKTLTIYHAQPQPDLSSTQSRKSRRRRRSRGDLDDWEPASSMAERTRSELGVSREEAMMEGTRMLMDNLREKITFLEDRCNKMEREKQALTELLSSKKTEHHQMKDHYKSKITELEDNLRRTSIDKERLLDRLKLPESERGSIREMELELAKMNKKLEEAENRYFEMMDENMSLKQEVKDLHLEMEEIHDQFREDEQLEFRELQKDLEVNAKNCRILQFKLRKSERRNEQLEADKMQLEEKTRQLESRFEARDDKQHIRELEEELKMAKEVSVRLHDELELVEEKRARYEEELDRVNDILTDSENSRLSLQKEIDNLNNEIDNLRRNAPVSKDSLGVVDRKKVSERQGSSEYGDMAQVMRDLQDSLERQNDLQDQMKFAEEEAHMMRKKIAELEEENESITIQLAKVSAAKSGKFFKKSAGILEQEVVSEREHELRLQMELAEQELKVLRRKMDEMQTLNETLIKELKRLERQLHVIENKEKDDSGRTEEEQMRSMALDIEKLKWRLIEQDQEADRQRRGGRLALKKSRSLEEESSAKGSEYQQDLRRQLETIQQEAGVLRDKLTSLEKENERLVEESKRHDLMKGRTPKVPQIKADDAVHQNIELQGRVKKLEEENQTLKIQIKTLDERTSKLSKEVTRSLSRSQSESLDYTESRGLRSQVRTLEEECNTLRKKVRQLEQKNTKLTKELEEKKSKKSKKEKKDKDKDKEKDVAKMAKEELRSKILSQESEIRDLKSFMKNREEENEKLEAELEEYREDLDKILDAFKKRERELVDEIEMLQNKNNVISNLLEIVTERAECTQKELYKSVSKERSRSPSAVSDMSGVSAGSDDVFVPTPEKVVEKDWEAQFMKRIESLERLLAEERQKLQAADKKLQMRDDTHAKQEDLSKMHAKEMQVIQQELTLAQGQLKDANKKVKDLKSKVEKANEESASIRAELEAKIKQNEDELKKVKEEKEKEEKQKSKQSASWIWEKNEMDRQIKDYKKKVEDLHAEVKKQQFKWKMAGEDIEREQKQRVQMQEQIEKLKESEEKYKKTIGQLDVKIDQLNKSIEQKASEQEKDKKSFERKFKKLEQEISTKEEVIKEKDEILSQKEEILANKTQVIKESDVKIAKFETEIKTHMSTIQAKTKDISDFQKEISEQKHTLKELQTQAKDKERIIRSQTDDLRSRDARLKEKDDILQNINRKLTDRETEIEDMDKTIRSAMKKLQDRENELKTTEKSCQEFEKQTAEFRQSNKEWKSKLKELELQYSRETKVIKDEKEKLSSDLVTLTKEKKALLLDLQRAKENLAKENELLKKEKNKLDLELKQAKEKLHSIRATGHMRESDALKALESEKETLITEKHRLKDEVNSLRQDLTEEAKKWNNEREDLQNIIKDKTKLIEDNSKIGEKMQKDIVKLKEQVSTSQKGVPIPVIHESSSASVTSSASGGEDLLNKIQTQDLMHQAEKIGLEELYEGKVKNLQEQVQQAEEYVKSLRTENDEQLKLIQSSRVALAELRKRYDLGLLSWNTDRQHFLEKIREAEDLEGKTKCLEKEFEEMKAKYVKEEAKRKELENKLSMTKSSSNITNAPTKAKKEEKSSSSGPGKVSDFRAKFEKFGGTSARRPSLTRSSSITEEEKANDDTQKLLKNLQTQIKDVEKTREKERQEYIQKTEQKGKEWEKEKKKLQERLSKLEEKVASLDETKQQLVKAQYQSHEDQEKWTLERNNMLTELEETKKMYVQEKGRITDIIAEVKKLQSLSESSTGDSNGKNGRTQVVISKPFEVKRQVSQDKRITGYVQEVLQRISKLVEVFEKAPPLRECEALSREPPVIKRSLSSSEVEVSEGIDNKTQPSIYLEPVSSRHSHTSTTQYALYESSTLGRARTRIKTTTKYSSGTQSAYGSRDQSPDNFTLFSSSRRSNLPKAPPSMIISPSHTPKRDHSVERKRASFTESDMRQLYKKLDEIEHSAFDRNRATERKSRAIEKERRGIRVLTKSMSVDNPSDDIPVYRTNHTDETQITRTKRYAAIAKIHSGLFDDAPLSSSLPASIVIGELVITPGAANLTKKARKLTKQRSDSVSPKTARKHFFEHNTASPKSYFSWPKRGREKSASVCEKLDVPDDESELEADNISHASSCSVEMTIPLAEERLARPEKRSLMSSLLKTVKDKRKIFRRSKSVDSSPVTTTVVRAGVSSMSPAAPSTYEPPKVPVYEPPPSKPTKQKKQSKFRRAASVDATTLFGASSHTHSSVVSSIIAQREAVLSSPSKPKTITKDHFDISCNAASSKGSLPFMRSKSDRWRNNPSFRLATTQKPIVVKKDILKEDPEPKLRRYFSASTLFSQTRV